MLDEKIKAWFADGEVDVDLMIKMGVTTEAEILELWNKEQQRTLNVKVH